MTKISNQYSLTNILTADLANSRLGINNVSPTVALDVTGAGKFSGVLTLGSTISNGTFAYTLPSATGTLALTSALSGTTNYVSKFTSSSAIGNSLIYDNNSNAIGIAVTTKSWDPTFTALQLGQSGCIWANTTGYGIQFGGNAFFDGSSYKYIISDFATRYIQSSGVHNWFTAPSGTAGNSITFTEAMRITSTGNVGIGTSSPDTLLHVSGAAGWIKAETSSTGSARFQAKNSLQITDFGTDSVGGFIQTQGNYPFLVYTNQTERMRITGSGNVGIGTTSPSQKLEVIGTTKLSSAAGNVTGINIIPGSQTNIFQTIGDGASGARFHASIETAFANYENTGSSQMVFKTETKGGSGTSDTSVVQMTIRPTGDIRITTLTGSGTRTVVADGNGQLSAPVSDKSVKENIRPIGYGINDIMKMNPVWFEFKEEFKDYGTGRQNGNIAQELEAIIPEAVFLTPQTNRKGIEYGQLHAVYIKAIQELKSENDSLKEVLLRNNIV